MKRLKESDEKESAKKNNIEIDDDEPEQKVAPEIIKNPKPIIKNVPQPSNDINILDLENDHFPIQKTPQVVRVEDDFDFFSGESKTGNKSLPVPVQVVQTEGDIDILDFDGPINTAKPSTQKIEVKKQGLFDIKSIHVKKESQLKISMDFNYIDLDPTIFQENWENFEQWLF